MGFFEKTAGDGFFQKVEIMFGTELNIVSLFYTLRPESRETRGGAGLRARNDNLRPSPHNSPLHRWEGMEGRGIRGSLYCPPPPSPSPIRRGRGLEREPTRLQRDFDANFIQFTVLNTRYMNICFEKSNDWDKNFHN